VRLAAVVLAVAVTYGAALGNEPGSVEQKHMTETQALDRAIAIMGLDKDGTWQRPEVDKAVTKLVMENDDTPFLHKEINGRAAYRVAMDSVPVVAREQTTDSVVALQRRVFEITIDAQSGQLLRIESKLGALEAKVATGEIRVAEAEWAEGQLAGVDETYVRLSPRETASGFLSVLAHTHGYPIGADLIVGRLIDVTVGSRVYSSVWVIDLYGVVRESRNKTLKVTVHADRCVMAAAAGSLRDNIPYAE
jgi:hypothetical protein